MSSQPIPAFALDNNGDCTNPKNQSISELVSKLRTAYQSKDFDQVKEFLVARETKLKREFENEKKENSLLTEKFQMENLDRIYLEDKLENQKKALEAALERERENEGKWKLETLKRLRAFLFLFFNGKGWVEFRYIVFELNGPQWVFRIQ